MRVELWGILRMISTDTPPRASSKTSRRILIVSSASLFIDYMAYAMMVPLTPVSPAGIHCTADESIIVFAYSIGLLIASANISRICRRLSHRSQMLLGTSTLACALCLIGSATHLSIYILGRLFQGAAAAVTSIAGFAAVARTYPNQRVRMLGMVLSAGSVGFISGPLFGGLLFGVGSYELPFLCFGFPVALLVLAQWRFLGGNNPKRAEYALCKPMLYGRSPGNRDDPDHCVDAHDPAMTLCRRPRVCASPSPLKRRSIGLPALLAGLCSASWATLEAMVPLTLYQDYEQTPQAVGTLFSANSLLATLTGLMIVMFASKVTSSQLAIIGLVFNCAIFFILALIAHIYALWLAVPLAGVAYSVLVNASTAMFAEREDGASPPGDVYQQAYGVFSIAYAIGYGLGSGMEYACASFASFHSTNLAAGCLCTGLLLIFVKYRTRARGP